MTAPVTGPDRDPGHWTSHDLIDPSQAVTVRVTGETIEEWQVRWMLAGCMSGSPLYEDCLVAIGELVLDEGDQDDNEAMARDRIAAAWNARKEVERG